MCKVANKKTEIKFDTSTPLDSKNNDEPLPTKHLKAQETLTRNMEPNWTTPYVQYLMQGRQWENDLLEAKKMIAYSS